LRDVRPSPAMSASLCTPAARVHAPSAASRAPAAASRRAVARLTSPTRRSVRARAENETAVAGESSDAPSTSTSDKGVWVPVCRPEDLPKGERREVLVNGESCLLFWYRNEIFCIESRSPAEGFYSEGFRKARFTQEYGIVCPTTGSVFSLKTGEPLELFPNNNVLRAITPRDTIANLRIFPVKVTQDALLVEASAVSARPWSRGGADSSLENNNVFFSEPKVYVEGTNPEDPFNEDLNAKGGSTTANAATALVALLGVAVLSVAGTAVLIFYEQYIGLGVFWLAIFGGVAAYAYNTVLSKEVNN